MKTVVVSTRVPEYIVEFLKKITEVSEFIRMVVMKEVLLHSPEILERGFKEYEDELTQKLNHLNSLEKEKEAAIQRLMVEMQQIKKEREKILEELRLIRSRKEETICLLKLIESKRNHLILEITDSFRDLGELLSSENGVRDKIFARLQAISEREKVPVYILVNMFLEIYAAKYPEIYGVIV